MSGILAVFKFFAKWAGWEPNVKLFALLPFREYNQGLFKDKLETRTALYPPQSPHCHRMPGVAVPRADTFEYLSILNQDSVRFLDDSETSSLHMPSSQFTLTLNLCHIC